MSVHRCRPARCTCCRLRRQRNKRSCGPIREQRQSLRLIILISSHFWILEGRICLPVTLWPVSKKIKCLSRAHRFFSSCLMQFFSGTSANSGGGRGFAALGVDNSAFARRRGEADAVRTSASFCEHHCPSGNHSKECPLCQRCPQGSCAEIFHTDQPGEWKPPHPPSPPPTTSNSFPSI